jgi:(p)ppGpp synthase/HD superfamily hydrolase
MSNNESSYEHELYKKALQFATEKHKGQKRLDGQDYITHPLALAKEFTDTKTKIVALLHDTLEDTNTTYDQLYNLFGSEITHAVVMLSKAKIVPYKIYIEQIRESNNPLIIKVKIADLHNNLSTINNIPDKDKRERLKSRYENALMVLQESNCI